MEFWDIYDAERKMLPRKHRRGMQLARGEFHIVVSVWVYNSKKELLLTKRAPQKESFPNLWENTGGSAVSGETSLQAIARELREETGIHAGEEEFILLDSSRERSSFYDTYLLCKDVAIADTVMQAGETCEARWVTLAQFKKMLAAGEVAAPIVRRFGYLEKKIKNAIGF
ncbi:MAG: NUDIX domain-containing protein [Oscillospiraceae bacterium]|jgi:isopentenyldiphosphate isomerase|nr:NUDIX domain-containing protein [Oscillospiraceae bacterium]